jgi:Amt family ammonium transporter
MLQGLLSGLVAASAIAGFVMPWAACVSGILAGMLYAASSRLLVGGGTV